MVQKIKVLDCTLRDGGYVNDWNFGYSNIQDIVSGLSASSIDLVELGFLTQKGGGKDVSLYNSFDSLELSRLKSKYTLMVNYGDYDFEKLESTSIEIRISFKKHELKMLKNYLSPLIKKNIKFSLNPMHISLYTNEELFLLSQLANDLSPVALTAVDSMGIMTECDVEKIFSVLDKNLFYEINLGCHFHDNLDNAFLNTKTLLNMGLDRTIIIDSCLGGISRGGGILKTELIAEYLNNHYGSHYDSNMISELSANFICQLSKKYELSNKKLYYISAKNRCHPNYAKYLYEKNFGLDNIDKILEYIPDENKPYYSSKIVEKILTELKI